MPHTHIYANVYVHIHALAAASLAEKIAKAAEVAEKNANSVDKLNMGLKMVPKYAAWGVEAWHGQ